MNRNVDDIMKTIADWKSKTQLNKLDDDDDNDENNIRSTAKTSTGLLANANVGGSTTRLFQPSGNTNAAAAAAASAASARLNLSRANEPSENSIKAEKYLDIVKDLKKKYTRSRTEVCFLRISSLFI